MTTIRDLHKDAMDLAEAALVARLKGDQEQALALCQQAYDQERQAAALLLATPTPEPTRSIILRSAAFLAAQCGDTQAAERLAASALAGQPPPDVADDLRDLFEQLQFDRHLSLRGLSLSSSEFQLSIAGNEIGPGIAPTEHVLSRLKDLERLVFRTVERLANMPFRDRGPTPKAARNYRLHLRAASRPASFAVTVRLGQPTEQLLLEGFDHAATIVSEIMTCIQLLNAGDQQQLTTRIPDPAYLRSFVGLVQRIAPDGDAVRIVGMTAVQDGAERRVLLTRLQDAITVPDAAKLLADRHAEPVTIRGQLCYADARREAAGEIKLVEDRGTTHSIVVPQGWMADIVKPMWEDTVEVTGVKQNGKILLQTIKPIPPDPAP